MPVETPGPVFVVGMWRSGTSLLYTLLNQHPGIALMYEADLPLLRQLFRNGRSKQDWLERWEFWNSALSRHRIDRQQIPHNVPDLRSAAEIVWKQYAGGALYGEKISQLLRFAAVAVPGVSERPLRGDLERSR